ncbi:hypothetical protein AN643_04315 [Candidatus Epulonipiscioides saccharophilum]|nr:hypothetical protein AN643_04315 [Epulopiscium sp. SCG-B10WGA-EpuloB]
MIKIFKQITIRTKIFFIYIVALIFTFAITVAFISIINQKYIEQQVRNAGEQTIRVLTENLNFIFDNVTQFSNLIYFDDNVQNALVSVSQDYIEPDVQKEIEKSLSNIILSADYIASAFIFDKYFNSYSAYKSAPIYVDPNKVVQTNWFAQMKEANGNGFFIHKSENVLQFPNQENLNYISYIREIGNKENYDPIATLLITIEVAIFQDFFDRVTQSDTSQFFIMDDEYNFIVPPKNHELEYIEYGLENLNNDKVISIANNTVAIISQKIPHSEWTLFGSFQIDRMKMSLPLYLTIIGIMILNIFVAVLYSVEINRLIFNPLGRMALHMQLIEQGQFIEMPIQGNDNNNEINRLKQVFNHMAMSIKTLIIKVKEEEQLNAKSEINLIQAQINPHFLYNTLDAVSALALMEDHERCFQMVQALGQFYRNTLNSGQNFITISQEVASISSYITILNIRYDDKIKFSYDIEEELKSQMILKLLLQPVVENAVYHGIKEKDGAGSIHIKIYRDEDEIIFIITDDGCGMEEARIHQILNEKIQTGNSGFGIYSLIQRVKLYYNIEHPVTIYSELDSGTEFIIKIPMV